MCIVVPLVALWLGAIDMAALPKPGLIERTIGELAFDGWLHRTAPNATNPFANEPDAIAGGLTHYRENCLPCHGAPGVEPAELAKGLHPGAPELDSNDTQEMSDGELFWTIKNGVRMTGMPAFAPTHSDEEIWKIVAFVRHLHNLPPEERSQLQLGTAEEHHHHEAPVHQRHDAVGDHD